MKIIAKLEIAKSDCPETRIMSIDEQSAAPDLPAFVAGQNSAAALVIEINR